VINDNAIEEKTSDCIKELTMTGFRIKNSRRESVLEISVEGNVCHILGTIFSSTGEAIAKGNATTFFVLKGPAIIGKTNNGGIGLKIG
jgi:hypothetical protein